MIGNRSKIEKLSKNSVIGKPPRGGRRDIGESSSPKEQTVALALARSIQVIKSVRAILDLGYGSCNTRSEDKVTQIRLSRSCKVPRIQRKELRHSSKKKSLNKSLSHFNILTSHFRNLGHLEKDPKEKNKYKGGKGCFPILKELHSFLIIYLEVISK